MLQPVLIVLLVLSCAFYPAFAIGHAEVLYKGEKSFGYYAMANSASSYNASMITFDHALERNFTAELFFFGNRSIAVYSDASNQLGLHIKQEILDFGWGRLIDIFGPGALWNASNGASVCFDLGGMIVVPLGEMFKFSAPAVVSIFRDGTLIDYSAGISFCPTLGNCDNELLFGIKGMQVSTSGSGLPLVSNATYGMVGLRFFLD